MRSANRVFRKKGCQGHTPPSSDELSNTTGEAERPDDGIRDGDTAGQDVVQREDEQAAGEGEETPTEVTWSVTLAYVE
jgi:hypothetical protein